MTLLELRGVQAVPPVGGAPAMPPRRNSRRREPQLRAANSGEEGARSPAGGSHLDEAPLQHGLHRGRDLRLVPSLPAAPGAQEDAVRDPRVLAEVAAQLAAEQLALGGGERGGRAFGCDGS